MILVIFIAVFLISNVGCTVAEHEICSIQLGGQSCTKLPSFENCHNLYRQDYMQLVWIYYSTGILDSSTHQMVKFLDRHVFMFRLRYSKPEGSVQVQLLGANCCYNETNYFASLKYSRSSTKDKCSYYQLERFSSGNFKCDLPLDEVIEITLFTHFILIRSNNFGLLLQDNSEHLKNPEMKAKFVPLLIFLLLYGS